MSTQKIEVKSIEVGEGIAPNPKQAMGDVKIQLQLVPSSVEIAIANGLVEGARKYGAWNWRDQPIQLMTYVGSLKRHMASWIEGEDIDPDGDGKRHLDGAIASLAIIIDAISSGSALDDRPKVKDEGATDALSNTNVNLIPRIKELETQLAEITPYARHKEYCNGYPATSEAEVAKNCDCGLQANTGGV